MSEELSFDAEAFLSDAGRATPKSTFEEDKIIFSQGEAADSIFYISKGKVKLTVLSEQGKAAVVAVLGPGDFFGEGCLAGQPLRMGTATAITPSIILVIEKPEMIRLLHAEHALSDRFIAPI